MIELMKPKLSFAQSEIQDGDVICFQVDLPDKEQVPSSFHLILLIFLVGFTTWKAKGFTPIPLSSMIFCRTEL